MSKKLRSFSYENRHKDDILMAEATVGEVENGEDSEKDNRKARERERGANSRNDREDVDDLEVKLFKPTRRNA